MHRALRALPGALATPLVCFSASPSEPSTVRRRAYAVPPPSASSPLVAASRHTPSASSFARPVYCERATSAAAADGESCMTTGEGSLGFLQGPRRGHFNDQHVRKNSGTQQEPSNWGAWFKPPWRQPSDKCGVEAFLNIKCKEVALNESTIPEPIPYDVKADIKRGIELHHPGSSQQVCPSYWCVSEEDFDEFIGVVAKMHLDGKIPNEEFNGKSNPNHDDYRYGPNMYLVVKHVTIPITRAAGGMSWALMKHPEGQPVDFFVTHAWAEGVYEFYHKVKRCWPKGKNAWICFMAMPEPLMGTPEFHDIMGTAEDMSDVPFVCAIEAPTCKQLLVVPNASICIYQRLWCIEEARRAIEKGLEVKLAFVDNKCEFKAKAREEWIYKKYGELAKKAEECERLEFLREKFASKIEAKTRAKTAAARDELGHDFQGVENASASTKQDEDRIRRAIKGKEDAINSMVFELIERGRYNARTDHHAERSQSSTVPANAQPVAA